jgi:hypothetical protein
MLFLCAFVLSHFFDKPMHDSNRARYWCPNDLFGPYTLHISSTMSIAFGLEGSFVPQGQLLYEAFEFFLK